ncbi:hypothetical protein HOH87_07115 [bacterium]|jgi:hypothetical protein|nr:hypothetical protein [bacterium]
MSNVSFKVLEDSVSAHAEDYENALNALESAANSSTTTGGSTLSISQATLATTKVQIHQALTEMASGIAKNASDHTKKLGSKVSS